MAAEDYFPMGLHSDDMEELMGDSGPPPTGAEEKIAPNAGKTWTQYEEAALRRLIKKGRTKVDIASKLGRTPYAIECRAVLLEIDDKLRSNDRAAPTPQLSMKETNVKITQLLTLLQENYTTVNVVLLSGGQPYTYKAPLDMKLELMDVVVVPTRDTFALARVMAVHDEPKVDFNEPYALKWVVQKVDMAAYDEQVAREAEAVAYLQKRSSELARERALRDLFGENAQAGIDELRALLNGGKK